MTRAKAQACLVQADLVRLGADLLGLPSERLAVTTTDAEATIAELVGRFGARRGSVLEGAGAMLVEAVRCTPLEAWEAEYGRLFDRDQHCPRTEGAYVRRDRGAILGDIAGFYRAFGLAIDEAQGPRTPDDLVCELEFVAALLVLVAHAELSDDAERAAIASDGLRSFAAEHLGDWLPAFCVRLAAVTELELYRALAVFLEALWEGVREFHGLEVLAGPPAEPEILDEHPMGECPVTFQ
ncbi:MAG: molecular chaperone TorD family protein [Deltaproteobacteria bacterium]|nr:molecular chaperone TorD family protein [Deltaproteobacteria bacterium]